MTRLKVLLKKGMVGIMLTLIISCNSKKENKVNITTVREESIVENASYNKAYQELHDMLTGKQEKSMKRAVFLVEWAYEQGNLNYEEYANQINQYVKSLQDFIKKRNVSQYKTAGNFALFEFFTKSNKMNGYKSYSYDFEDFNGARDWSKTFVTKLMRTHTGQCRSLPLFYKILSDEIGAQSYLAFAPNHLYIKHLGEDGKWVNVELTNGHFASDAFIISSTGISAESIKNKIYMDALDDTQNIAFCLSELSRGYQHLYGYDDFVLKCCNESLAYFPNCITTLLHKYNTLKAEGLEYIKVNGRSRCAYLDSNFIAFKQTQERIESLGFREMSDAKYEDWLVDMEKEKEKAQKNQKN